MTIPSKKQKIGDFKIDMMIIHDDLKNKELPTLIGTNPYDNSYLYHDDP